MEEDNSDCGGGLVITKFEQIAPTMRSILGFLLTEDAQESIHRAICVQMQLAATQDITSAGQCIEWQIQSIIDSCKLVRECADGRVLVAKPATQSVLGTVLAWHEVKKKHEAEARQGRAKANADRKAKPK